MAKLIPLDPVRPDRAVVADLAARLRAGQVLAVPTDTIYGLAADARNAAAVERIFAIKGREDGKPLPLLVGSLEAARAMASAVPPALEALAREFWPGPLSLVLPVSAEWPAALRAGGRSLAVRWPRAAIAQALLDACGGPLTATSANRSGAAGCRTAAEVAAQLGERLEIIVDGGTAAGSQPSTLLDLTGGEPRLVREGAIARAALARWLSAR